MNDQGGDLHQSPNGETSDIISIKSRAEKKLSERGEAPALDKRFLDAAQAAAKADMEAKAARDAAAEAARDAVRTFIARLMLMAFLPSVLVLIVLIVFLHWNFPNDKEVADRITSIYKDMLLPVITLILGYFLEGDSCEFDRHCVRCRAGLTTDGTGCQWTDLHWTGHLSRVSVCASACSQSSKAWPRGSPRAFQM